MHTTALLHPDPAGIERAARLLMSGGLVAFPTETVYGLGADATDDSAVAAIFRAKARPQFNPLIVHVAALDTARRIAVFDDNALRLASAFWPGALTLVLPLRAGAGLAPRVSAGLDNVALRVPDHPLARALLERVRVPVAAPSANPSGRISPTTAHHVLAGLNGRIAAVLDGGPCPVGLESTIIGGSPTATLLRPGGLPVEEIEACLGQKLVRNPDTELTAPGQMASHYAPRARLRLNADAPRPGERFLGFGAGGADLNLSVGGNLAEAAANLFGHLHALDHAGTAPIAVARIPDKGLGRAINDRLRRAAAPRP